MLSFYRYFLTFITDPPSKTIDQTSAHEFRDLLNLNLVNYFLFCKVSLLITRKCYSLFLDYNSALDLEDKDFCNNLAKAVQYIRQV